ncbi:uncharacterized protein LOC129614164 [Condylostylus longicornis]|uniref:uncharacterized protein LOC129614164 n=1 Tax=Condylostylus longicornis TaxID=2530218 RepID=UPI00244DF153|nr:uncharacterized protein LOC129614164 [Condylostylus longicornis]
MSNDKKMPIKQTHSTNPLMPPTSDFFRANPSALEEETNADSNPFSPATEIKHEVSALPPDTLYFVIDILNNPPSSRPYETLKGALVERHSLSKIKKLESLLDRVDIGDRRPSDVFKSMRMLAGSLFNENIIGNLWLRRLPRNIYITLLVVCDKPMKELTSLADKIYKASQPVFLNAVSRTNKICASSPVSNQLTDTSSNLEDRLSRIEEMLAKFNTGSTFRSRSRSRNSSQNRSASGQPICWYHQKFGREALKCVGRC